MITLGLNAAFHDSAAAIVADGVVVAASEEERFSRIKHAKRPVPFTAWELPFHAVDDCLRQAGCTLADVDHVAYSLDPRAFAAGRAIPSTIELPLLPQHPEPGAWDNPWDPLFLCYVMNAPGQLIDGAPHHLQRRLRVPDPAAPPWRWHWLDHHLCHQASAFLAAPVERAAVLTLDGRGERATTTYGAWSPERGYRALGVVEMPHSLGILYEQVTTHLGFLHSSDEYKVMALAALGRPTLRGALRDQVQVHERGRYTIEPIDLESLAGPRRERGAPLEQRHLNLAASLQAVLEDVVLKVACWLREASGERNLAMAGGVALNCVMNAKLRDAGIFERVWVQPAAGDAGTALGAALWVDHQERGGPRCWRMEHAYLGPAYDDAAIEKALSWAKLPFRRCASDAELVDACATLLSDDRILGWFQGRMEFGPRALGARSILASPLHPQMQARLNELKDREDFRPVAPVVPKERFADWFAHTDRNGGDSPFMLFVYDVAPERAARIPAACHADRSARVQTVDAATNPRLHALLEAFAARTGVPVLVNTSFNVRGDPIVCTPRHAIEAFCSTPLDALAIGPFVVEKCP
jgi:carbamoyltransferase